MGKFKKILNLDLILATALIFGAIYLIANLNDFLNLDFLNPIESTFNDFELTDIVYSKINPSEDLVPDTNIVIINFANLSRLEIAEKLFYINNYSPRVIGIDAFFSNPKDSASDAILSDVLHSNPNIVIVSQLINYDKDTDKFRGIKKSHSSVAANVKSGFANMYIDDESTLNSVRQFMPRVDDDNVTEKSFPVRVAEIFSSQAAKQFLAKADDFEYIKYRGNLDKFPHLEAADISDTTDLSILKGKIVLLGYFCDEGTDKTLTDLFYTPLNERYLGKAIPDMYGIVIHANIISMIINGEKIYAMSTALSIVISILLCWFNLLLFHYIVERFPVAYEGGSVVIFLVESVIILWLTVVCLHEFDYHPIFDLPLFCAALSVPIFEMYDGTFKPLFIRLFNKLRKRK